MTSFFFEKDYTYLLIEQEGKDILALEDAHNVRIDIQCDGKVVITEKENEAAKGAFESMIELKVEDCLSLSEKVLRSR